MKRVRDFGGVYLHRHPVDLRKAINGLAQIVEAEMGQSVFSDSLFVFTNRNRTRIKILYWDRTGFALWMKRLETERFPWPVNTQEQVVAVTAQQLDWLLDGYEYWKLKPHSIVEYTCVG